MVQPAMLGLSAQEALAKAAEQVLILFGGRAQEPGIQSRENSEQQWRRQ